MKKVILLLTVCIFWFSLYIYIPFLTPFLLSLGLTAALAGIIFGAHSFTQLLLRLPVGIKSDALGKQKPFIILGMLFTVISSLIMYFFPSPAMLLVGNAISGFASTMYVSFTVLYALYYPTSQTSKAMGVMSGVVEIGIFAAFMLGGILYDKSGIKALFFTSAAVAAIGLIISFFIKEKPAPKQAVAIKDVLAVMKDRRLIVSSVLGILIKGLIFATVYSFTPKMAQDIGANGTQVGIINALFIAASILGAFFVATKAGKKFGYRRMGVLGFILTGAMTISIPFIKSIPVFMAVQFMGGLGYSSLTSIFMANAIKNFDANKKPIAMGFYQAAYSLGSAMGPVLMGVLADTLHYTAAYLLISLAAVAGVILVLAGYRKKAAAS